MTPSLRPTKNQSNCPLCMSGSHFYYQDKKRNFYQCAECKLVFAAPEQWLSAQSEKQEYDLHENNLADEGYNRFLSRIVEPVMTKVSVGHNLLDFGCGPAPALAQQFEAKGLNVALFDVFYHNTPANLLQRYHAITLTEVIEHLHEPLTVIEQLWQCLETNGVLAIMTQRVISLERFAPWQYKNDPTHVCFFSDATFYWIANHLQAECLEFVDKDIVLLTKTA
ncbi:class I SAM-dependent methyltransferase [Reinekea sp.]|jgi:hypothetical protein|uniref:class I SAM-dependent methyltransferase n=1 Tax=Reinekea sp. TaxID=1970455 RepID=UPI003989BBF3